MGVTLVLTKIFKIYIYLYNIKKILYIACAIIILENQKQVYIFINQPNHVCEDAHGPNEESKRTKKIYTKSFACHTLDTFVNWIL